MFGDGCWETVKRVFALVTTLWGGCAMALVAFFLAEVVGAVLDGAWGDVGEIIVEMGVAVVWALLWAPFVFLLSVWGLVLVPLLGVVMFLMFRAEREVTWLWYGMVGCVGLLAMGGFEDLPTSYVLTGVRWFIFFLMMVALAVACWFYRGWQRNAHARHLMEVHAENELRRLEMAQRFGTKSFGQGNVDEVKMDEESGK